MAKKGKTDVIFKALALVGLTVGGVAIAQAVNTRVRRKEDEAIIEEIVTESQNFSGVIGDIGKDYDKDGNFTGCSKDLGNGDFQQVPCPTIRRGRGTRSQNNIYSSAVGDYCKHKDGSDGTQLSNGECGKYIAPQNQLTPQSGSVVTIYDSSSPLRKTR